MKWSTREIAESVLLDCFYKSLGVERKKLVDKLVLGGLLHPPYAIASQLIDTMSMTNNEAEKEHTLASLLTQLDLGNIKVPLANYQRCWCAHLYSKFDS